MSSYAVVIKNGTIVDGTRKARYVADIGIRNGRIAKIGKIGDVPGARIIDAHGLVVAPGHVDLHTHYDAQVHWDPYCSNSGENGVTTVVTGNCGFGFAPCRKEDRDRYMRMMENTEQVPYEQMKATLPWTWETFPEWLAHLRRLPKGVNHLMFLPINPLMIYVMGIDAAKSRPATPEEMSRMKALVHEAMDAGAAGIAFSFLGTQNSHTDYDNTPMPTDTMSAEDAAAIASVLAERGEGFIQVLSILGGYENHDIAETVARAARRPVIQNIFAAVEGMPDFHRPQLRWLDRVVDQGMDMWGQAFLQRAWSEFNMFELNINDHVPEWRELSSLRTVEAKIAKMSDPDFVQRMKANYSPMALSAGSGPLELITVLSVAGIEALEPLKGKLLSQIAVERGQHAVEVMLDIAVQTRCAAEFRTSAPVSGDIETATELLLHPRILPGTSDGGAHSRFYIGGHWPTELLIRFVRDEKRVTLEEMHYRLAALPAQVAGMADRGTIAEGQAADLLVYDLDGLWMKGMEYEYRYDMPNKDWRRYLPTGGYRYTLVNGQVTLEDGRPTGSLSGDLLRVTQPRKQLAA